MAMTENLEILDPTAERDPAGRPLAPRDGTPRVVAFVDINKPRGDVLLDELERLLAEGAVEVIDVREADERDGGYIPGSRNIPYRLVREWVDDLQGGRPVVTICSSGPRAAVAASVLAAAGIDARPVMDAGVTDWKGGTVSFRRCGS